ncbi:MAG: 4a-hydroxytetrahydrobiopterin dehydratase [SAR202 cluster bacterium]|nr:4a-hydroxytetrahydrobiopterin dehydratase [SAR202 cluster bacterium]
MPDIADERCAPVRAGSPRVTEADLPALLARVPGWEVVVDDGIRALRKRFKFHEFDDGLAFVTAVAKEADVEDHHPKVVLEFQSVTVYWTAHAIADLHRNDFIMAAHTDRLYGGPPSGSLRPR